MHELPASEITEHGPDMQVCERAGTNAYTDVHHTAYTLTTAGDEGMLALLPVLPSLAACGSGAAARCRRAARSGGRRHSSSELDDGDDGAAAEGAQQLMLLASA